MANITIKHIINEGTLVIGGNVEEISIASVPALTTINESNPFSNGLVTKDARAYDNSGQTIPDINDIITIDANGDISFTNGVIPYTNIKLICIGA